MTDRSAKAIDGIAAAHPDLDVLDLHSVARILQPLHPEYSWAELVRLAAELGVERGYRYLVWDQDQER